MSQYASNLRKQEFAAAGGHIRTIGKLLLEEPVGATKLLGPDLPLGAPAEDVPEQDQFLNPLRLLCLQGEYTDLEWLVSYCQEVVLPASKTVISLKKTYSQCLVILSSLQPRAVYRRLLHSQEQDYLFQLGLLVSRHKTRASIAWKSIMAARTDRLLLAQMLLNHGADPNWGEKGLFYPWNDSLEVSTAPAWKNGRREDYTPLQFAAASGFTDMIELLLERGANLNCKIAIPNHPFDNLKVNALKLPITLAAKYALRCPTDNAALLGFEMLLNAGSSFEGSAVILPLIRPRVPRRRQRPIHLDKRRRWLEIVDLLLKHIEAKGTDDEPWDGVYVDACWNLDNLDYCKRLDVVRPVRDLGSEVRLQMLREVVFTSCEEASRHPGNSSPDLELIRWVFEQCRHAGGRVAHLKLELGRLKEEVLEPEFQSDVVINLLGALMNLL